MWQHQLSTAQNSAIKVHHLHISSKWQLETAQSTKGTKNTIQVTYYLNILCSTLLYCQKTQTAGTVPLGTEDACIIMAVSVMWTTSILLYLIPTVVKEVKVPSHGHSKLLCNISNYLPTNKASITSNKASVFSSSCSQNLRSHNYQCAGS
jgi:hypothetical protein